MFGDSDKVVSDKVKAAVGAGLSVIACVGETLEQREGGVTKEVVEKQLQAIADVISKDDWK
jgi:triosephosphate isomerase